MPLITATLTAQLFRILSLEIKSDTTQMAGSLWASAYDSYTKTGLVAGVPTIAPQSALAALQSSFGDAFSNNPGAAALVASQLASALVTYWTSVSVVGMLGPPLAITGVPAFIAIYTKIASDKRGTAREKSRDYADVFNTFTTMITVPMPPQGNPTPVT